MGLIVLALIFGGDKLGELFLSAPWMTLGVLAFASLLTWVLYALTIKGRLWNRKTKTTTVPAQKSRV